MGKKTVIIGGVAGGATAAARLRRRDETARIVVLERGEYVSYANCGLPYYIGDVIKNRSALLLQTPEGMKTKYHVDVRVSNEVTRINRAAKTVSVKDLKTGKEYEESYDNLVIATGSSPAQPSIPGIDGPGIYTLWTVPDTDVIKACVTGENRPARAAVIGGGFIGLEMTENLRKAGLEVTLIETLDQVMEPLDFEMAQLLHETLEKNQVELILGDRVVSFANRDGETEISLQSGRAIKTDMVLLAVGVQPNSALAGEAGLELNQKGGIVVDKYMKTSDENIYAVGDVIQVEDFVLKTPTMVPLAGPANKQARICADNIAGDQKAYGGTQGTSVIKVFDLAAASVGVNEKTLKALGKAEGTDYHSILIVQKTHAGYYPGSGDLTLKMMFTPEGAILGAQIVGKDGADKRLNTIATVMRLGGTVHDLTDLELAYAPPFSSAKDPVNMLGYVAENVLEGMVDMISWDEMDDLAAGKDTASDLIILDVTEAEEREVYAVANSCHIPLGELRERCGELDKDKLVVVYCRVGVRAYNGARILQQNGFSRVQDLEGGMTFYKSMHYKELMGSK